MQGCRNRTIVLVLIVPVVIFKLLGHYFPDTFSIGDIDIAIYPSSTIFTSGTQGRVSGGGLFGQYNATGGGSGGCCKSSEIRRNLGRPEGEVVVRWNAYDEKTEKRKYYYAFHPNPKIEIPREGEFHHKYIIFYSFGQLALRKEALTEEELLNAPRFNLTRYKTGYQIGTANTFYYKVVSDAGFKFFHFLDMPLKEFHSIEGIEVTTEQYDYIMENKYLDKNAPNLTQDQLAYIKQQNDKKSFWNFIF